MIIYFTVWLFLTFLICLSVKQSNTSIDGTKSLNIGIITVAGIIYVLFASFRKIYPHTDIYTYNNYFNAALNMSLSEYLNYSIFEPGYSIITWTIGQFTSDFRVVMVFLYSIIYILHIYLLSYVKYNEYKYLCLSIICLGMFTPFYLMRNFVSIGIGFVSIIMCSKKKYFKSLFYVALAVTFHNAALILFPVVVFNYLFDSKDVMKKWTLAVFIVLSVAGTFALSSFLVKYINGSDKYYVYSNQLGSVAIGVDICMAVLIIFSLKKMTELTQLSQFNKTLIISLCANPIVIPLQLQYKIMYRMNYYFIPLHFILLMELQGIYSKKSLNFFIIRLLTVVYSIYRIYSFFFDEIQYITRV